MIINKNSIIKIALIVGLFLGIVEAKVYKVGFAQDTLANDWRKAQVDEAVEYAKKYNFLELTVIDAKGSVANQIAAIEKFIKEDYDFIITSPISSSITSIVLKKAIEKGIKVILIDRGIQGDYYTSFIAPDNYKIAQQSAKYLLKKMNYKGTILMLQGVEGATPTILREKGFEDIAKNYENIKIIKVRGNYLRQDAIKAVKNLYEEGIKFDAIYSHSDSMATGVKLVMENYQDNRNIPIVGIDYIKEAKEAILNGKQLASFVYPTCAKEGIETIVSIIEGKEIKKNQTIETIMVDKNNVMDIEPIF